jgi:hypothetical protein
MWWRKLYNYLAGDIAGDVVREGPQIKSVYDGFHQWRIKQTEAGEDRFISLYFRPSFGYWHSGNPFTYLYVEIDLAGARRSLNSLSEIINIMENKNKGE